MVFLDELPRNASGKVMVRELPGVPAMSAARGATRRSSAMDGVDAGFLYMETPSMHMHTLKIAILEPTETSSSTTSSTAMLAGSSGCRRCGGAWCRCRSALNHPVW